MFKILGWLEIPEILALQMISKNFQKEVSMFFNNPSLKLQFVPLSVMVNRMFGTETEYLYEGPS